MHKVVKVFNEKKSELVAETSDTYFTKGWVSLLTQNTIKIYENEYDIFKPFETLEEALHHNHINLKVYNFAKMGYFPFYFNSITKEVSPFEWENLTELKQNGFTYKLVFSQP